MDFKSLFFRFALIPILLLCSIGKSVAQQKDSVQQHRILLMPYIPDYYLSDADQDIMKESKKEPEEFRNSFRRGLDLRIAAELESVGHITDLLQDSSKNSKAALEGYYRRVELAYANPTGPGREKKEKKKGENVPKALLEDQAAPNYMTAQGNAQYMQSTVSDTQYLAGLMTQYKSEYLLSVNQVEIKTNYNSCIDIANKIYRREFIVHYTLLDGKGKVVSGNLIKSFFPSSSNRESDILARCIPVIASQLKDQITQSVDVKSKKP